MLVCSGLIADPTTMWQVPELDSAVLSSCHQAYGSIVTGDEDLRRHGVETSRDHFEQASFAVHKVPYLDDSVSAGDRQQVELRGDRQGAHCFDRYGVSLQRGLHRFASTEVEQLHRAVDVADR